MNAEEQKKIRTTAASLVFYGSIAAAGFGEAHYYWLAGISALWAVFGAIYLRHAP